jgi:phosphotransferase system HPr-like phosphotransfer protein
MLAKLSVLPVYKCEYLGLFAKIIVLVMADGSAISVSAFGHSEEEAIENAKKLANSLNKTK